MLQLDTGDNGGFLTVSFFFVNPLRERVTGEPRMHADHYRLGSKDCPCEFRGPKGPKGPRPEPRYTVGSTLLEVEKTGLEMVFTNSTTHYYAISAMLPLVSKDPYFEGCYPVPLGGSEVDPRMLLGPGETRVVLGSRIDKHTHSLFAFSEPTITAAKNLRQTTTNSRSERRDSCHPLAAMILVASRLHDVRFVKKNIQTTSVSRWDDREDLEMDHVPIDSSEDRDASRDPKKAASDGRRVPSGTRLLMSASRLGRVLGISPSCAKEAFSLAMDSRADAENFWPVMESTFSPMGIARDPSSAPHLRTIWEVLSEANVSEDFRLEFCLQRSVVSVEVVYFALEIHDSHAAFSRMILWNNTGLYPPLEHSTIFDALSMFTLCLDPTDCCNSYDRDLAKRSYGTERYQAFFRSLMYIEHLLDTHSSWIMVHGRLPVVELCLEILRRIGARIPGYLLDATAHATRIKREKLLKELKRHLPSAVNENKINFADWCKHHLSRLVIGRSTTPDNLANANDDALSSQSKGDEKKRGKIGKKRKAGEKKTGRCDKGCSHKVNDASEFENSEASGVEPYHRSGVFSIFLDYDVLSDHTRWEDIPWSLDNETHLPADGIGAFGERALSRAEFMGLSYHGPLTHGRPTITHGFLEAFTIGLARTFHPTTVGTLKKELFHPSHGFPFGPSRRRIRPTCRTRSHVRLSNVITQVANDTGHPVVLISGHSVHWESLMLFRTPFLSNSKQCIFLVVIGPDSYIPVWSSTSPEEENRMWTIDNNLLNPRIHYIPDEGIKTFQGHVSEEERSLVCDTPEHFGRDIRRSIDDGTCSCAFYERVGVLDQVTEDRQRSTMKCCLDATPHSFSSILENLYLGLASLDRDEKELRTNTMDFFVLMFSQISKLYDDRALDFRDDPLFQHHTHWWDAIVEEKDEEEEDGEKSAESQHLVRDDGGVEKDDMVAESAYELAKKISEKLGRPVTIFGTSEHGSANAVMSLRRIVTNDDRNEEAETRAKAVKRERNKRHKKSRKARKRLEQEKLAAVPKKPEASELVGVDRPAVTTLQRDRNDGVESKDDDATSLDPEELQRRASVLEVLQRIDADSGGRRCHVCHGALLVNTSSYESGCRVAKRRTCGTNETSSTFVEFLWLCKACHEDEDPANRDRLDSVPFSLKAGIEILRGFREEEERALRVQKIKNDMPRDEDSRDERQEKSLSTSNSPARPERKVRSSDDGDDAKSLTKKQKRRIRRQELDRSRQGLPNARERRRQRRAQRKNDSNTELEEHSLSGRSSKEEQDEETGLRKDAFALWEITFDEGLFALRNLFVEETTTREKESRTLVCGRERDCVRVDRKGIHFDCLEAFVSAF